MGTATTVSVIDKQGNYAGGMIIPGVGLSLEALSNQASQLPHISLDLPTNHWKKYNSLYAKRYYIWNRSNDRRYYRPYCRRFG